MNNTHIDKNPLLDQRALVRSWGPRSLVEERDACGVGFVADQYGRASHELITQALSALDCMEHRGGRCADQDSGDGAGVMTAIPWQMLKNGQKHRAVPIAFRQSG